MLRVAPVFFELAAIVLISTAAFMVSVPLGLLIVGVAVGATGLALDRLVGDRA